MAYSASSILSLRYTILCSGMFSSNPTLSALLSKLFDLEGGDESILSIKETCANVKAKLLEQAQQIPGSILAWDDRMTDNAWVEVCLS